MSLNLKVVSIKRVLFKGTVDYCEIPAKCGIEGILPGHINFLSSTNSGVIKYKIGESLNEFKVEEGFVEVSNDNINVLVRG